VSHEGGIGYGSATTAADGTYSISGLPVDSYVVEFDPTCGGSVVSSDAPLWFMSGETPRQIVAVSVSSGEDFSGIDATLLEDGSISGTVTDAAHPGGLGGVCVTATSSDGGIGHGTATTAGDGTYTMTGLPPDLYAVQFDPTCGGADPSPDVPCALSSAIAVPSGATASGVDVVLRSVTTTTAVVWTESAGVGTNVKYRAIVSGSPGVPTGRVAFRVGATLLCKATLSAGRARCSSTAAPVGADVVTASYSGSSTFGPSASTASIVVHKLTPTESVKATPTSVLHASWVTYRATVSGSPGVPTGRVAFRVGATLLCKATLSAGRARCSSTAAPVGADVVTASYSGSSTFASSVATTTLVVVLP
jgi:hypothetical protein